jgi:hypothetical protein
LASIAGSDENLIFRTSLAQNLHKKVSPELTLNAITAKIAQILWDKVRKKGADGRLMAERVGFENTVKRHFNNI